MELITTAQAAEILGITDTRVRQLTAAGAISCRQYGPRIALYKAAEIEAYAAVARGAAISGIAATAAPADTPLELVINSVVDIAVANPWFDPTHTPRIHLRIYQSPSRTVVIVGAIHASVIGVGGWHFADFIAPAIADKYLRGSEVGSDTQPTYWLTHDPDGSPGNGVMTNHVIQLRLAGTSSGRWFGRDAVTEHRDVRDLGDVPLSTVDRLIGQTIQVFPARDTADFVTLTRVTSTRPESWPIRRVIDHHNLRGIAATLQVLTEHRGADPHTVDIAAAVLAEYLDTVTSSPRGMQLPDWMARIESTNPDRAGVDLAHSLILPELETLSDIAWRDISTPRRVSVDELSMAWAGLGAWLDSLDPGLDSTSADMTSPLRAAVATSMDMVGGAHDRRRHVDDTIAPLRPYPTADVRRFTIHSVEDPVYRQVWQAAHAFDDHLPLAAKFGAELRAITDMLDCVVDRIGTLPDGTHIAQTSSVTGQDFDFIAMWPFLTSDSDMTVPATAYLVADERAVGDRPVFVVDDSTPIRPLPQLSRGTAGYVCGGWNFGYSGTGPGHLADAIVHAIRRPGRSERRLVDNMFTTPVVGPLRIAAADIHRALDDIPPA